MAVAIFLTLGEALAIHLDQCNRYGGNPGIRDLGLLKSALAMPQAGIGEQYFHEDLFDMAAAYLYHIVNNHPFADGNKRTGAVVAIVFLALNGIEACADECGFEGMIREVSEGKLRRSGVAEFLRQNKV